MIPKIIHYCWFGKGPMPQSQVDCIKTWKKIMPGYKIMRWDESNFDVNFCEYSKEAYNARKFAYVSDVARCKALLEYGGIYFDTDVEVFKPFDAFLKHDFFSAIELYREFYQESTHLIDEVGKPKSKEFIPHLELLTSSMGSIAHNKLVNDMLDYYKSIRFENEVSFFSIDRLLPFLAVNYGFRYVDELQELSDNMVIYPTGIFGHAFCVNPKFSVSYHYNAASWESNKTKKQQLLNRLDELRLLKLYNLLRGVKRKIFK